MKCYDEKSQILYLKICIFISIHHSITFCTSKIVYFLLFIKSNVYLALKIVF